MQNILIIFFIVIITFIPILLWWYIFSSFWNQQLNRKRFLAWIIGWAVSVLPILYLEKFIDKLNLWFLNVFYFVENIWSSPFSFVFSLIMLIIFILFLSFIIWFLFEWFVRSKKIFLKNFWIFVLFSIIISIFIYLFNYFDFFDKTLNETSSISFWNTIFNSLKLMIFYYILVWILEEISKHFNFLQTSFLHISNIKEGILYSVFVALWFSFIENILYFYNIYSILWFSSELVTTYFLRSIFSVFVHIFASFIIWYYFSKAYLDFKKNWKNFEYIKIFLSWIFLWILVHSIFDISLSLGFSFIIFLYFIFWYFYMWKILLKDDIDFLEK